jgi:zinc-ribbon domain
MRCAQCGAENRAGARFCDACGVALAGTSLGSAASSATGADEVRKELAL